MRKRIIYFLCTIVLLTSLQFLLMGSHFAFSFELAKYHFNLYLGNMIFNIILLFLLFKMILVATNKLFFSWFLTASIIISFSLGNHFMITYRDEPILPSDLAMVTKAFDIVSYLNKEDFLLICIVILFILACLVGSYFIRNQTIYNKKERIIQGGIVLLISVVLFWGPNLDNNFKRMGTLFGYSNQFWDMEIHYSQNGPVAGFLSISDVIAMDTIKYKKEDVSFLSNYAKLPSKNKDDQIVIYVLLESFIDPTRIEEANIDHDPIPFIRQLMDTYTSGLLYQSTIGGGTSKAEYETLTSFSNSFFHKSVSTPYQFPIPNLPTHPMIGDLFDSSIAIHSAHAKLYRRTEVFNKFGFDRFKYEGNTEDPLVYQDKIENHRYISDLSAFKEVLHTMEEVPTNENAFIYLATIQNHSPYQYELFPSIDFTVTNPIYDVTTKESFESYLQGLKHTDDAVEYFVSELGQINRPVTVVFFGDHYPPFAKNLVEPGENFKTDYFIYQNYQQKKLDYAFVSPNFLSAITLKLINLEPSPYYRFIGDMFEQFTVLHEQSIVRDGATFEDYTVDPKIQNFYEHYKLLQYDIVAGKQYSIDMDYFKNR